MVSVNSTMMPLGSEMPPFELPDPTGQTVAGSSFQGTPLLVMFICNHCPYVKHIRPRLAEVTKDLAGRGLAVVGINSNDSELYPDDSPEAMKAEAEEFGYTFPYLVDEDQSVAKAFRAACTPDLFLFDGEGKLAYRGQFDSSRPKNNEPVTGADLMAAAEAVLEGRPVPEDQRPSIGCNIKWKPGNEPDYFG
ncbi:MAG TPA: thioredoxin family protein [Actinomycetota bacterium]|jgi:peroxiredoxin|nr:thioredoxin family protein [Actinomycetota bacterium]